MRGRRLLTPSRHRLAPRKQLLQPALDRPTGTRRQIGPITSASDRHAPLLAKQDVVSGLCTPRLRDNAALQPYFSPVNNFFRDHQRQPIAVGELLADARRGLEMLQHRLVPADTLLPLPAPVALDILLAANTLRANLTWSPATRAQLERFRAGLAVCVNYTFFCRAETTTRRDDALSSAQNVERVLRTSVVELD
jgi:hypothetical protein